MIPFKLCLNYLKQYHILKYFKDIFLKSIITIKRQYTRFDIMNYKSSDFYNKEYWKVPVDEWVSYHGIHILTTTPQKTVFFEAWCKLDINMSPDRKKCHYKSLQKNH